MEFPTYPDNWNEIKKRIKIRDDYTCRKCNKKFPPNSPYLQVHHKVSLSKGGKNNDSNLISLCKKCHTKKHPHLEGSKKRDYRQGYKRKSFGRYTKKR